MLYSGKLTNGYREPNSLLHRDYVPSTDAGIVVTLIWLPCSFIFTSIYISTIVSCYFSTAKKTIREMEAAMRVEQQATSSIQNTTNNNHNLMQVELEFPCSDFRTHNIHSTRSTKKVACPTDQYHELSSPSIATAPTASTTTSSTFTANLDEAMMFISQNA